MFVNQHRQDFLLVPSHSIDHWLGKSDRLAPEQPQLTRIVVVVRRMQTEKSQSLISKISPEEYQRNTRFADHDLGPTDRQRHGSVPREGDGQFKVFRSLRNELAFPAATIPPQLLVLRNAVRIISIEYDVRVAV